MTDDTSRRRTISPMAEDLDSNWPEALRDGRLLLPRCSSCGRCSFPPMPGCPHCGATGMSETLAASGLGRVYSWVVVHDAADPAFTNDVPYAILAVDLDEGPRVFGRFLAADDDPTPGLRVRVAPYSSGGRAGLGFEQVLV